MSTIATTSKVPPVPARRIRRRSLALLVGAILLGIAGVLVLTPATPFEMPPFETGTFKVIVVDSTNKRVPNAQLTPHGLRSLLEPGTGYGWSNAEHGPPITSTTDENGEADVSYPKWVGRADGLLTGAVSLVIEHPEFCHQGNMDAQVPQKGVVSAIPRIPVMRGGRLRIKAFRPGETEPLREFQTQISGLWSDGPWTTDGDAKLSPVIESGDRLIRIVDRTDPERLQFSQVIPSNMDIGRTEAIEVHLEAGITIHGGLDSAVPRPVKNGIVVVSTFDGLPSRTGYGLVWETWTTICENGEFEVTSLPPVKEVRMLAWCDGFVSKMPPKDVVPARLQRLVRGRWLPQFFPVTPDASYEVRMEPAARCEFTVRGPDGKPAKGVEVGLWPNVTDEQSCWSFGRACRFDKIIPKQQTFAEYRQTEDADRKDSTIYLHPRLTAKTDADGRAVIENLPGRGPTWATVSHESLVVKGYWNPPFDAEIGVKLESGKTATCAIAVAPKPKLNPRRLVPSTNKTLRMMQEAWSSVQNYLGL